MEIIRVKEWLYDKVKSEARSNHAWIDIIERTYDAFQTAKVEDGFVKIAAEVLKETDKAINVKIDCDGTLGAAYAYAWLPKSQIVRA